jgi:hypothetical protein
MNKLSKRNSTTIGFMTLFAIVILVFYYYWTARTEPVSETSVEELTEYQQIMNVDLEKNYPATPREVVKLFGRIIKFLYNSPKEEEIKPLALKIRKLYDPEFLADNPEDDYLNDLYSDIASWKEQNRKITNYLLVNEDLEQDSEINGVRYSVKYISYTIKEKGKFTETWKVLLRQDESDRWKIVGWEFVPADDKQDEE